EQPRWVAAVDIQPRNPRVTHHARLGLDDSQESVRRDASDPEPGYSGMAWGHDPDGQLVTWVPGMAADKGLPSAAWSLSPRGCLVLHTHLQPSGKPESVGFQIGIYFADRPPTISPLILRIGSRDIAIPPEVKEHSVDDEYELPIGVSLHSIFPHAHSLCTQVHVTAAFPDGSTMSLIDIDQFDENWHDNYRYTVPPRLPKGTRLRTHFTYDNSEDNPRNRHHPPKRVSYGSQADDEMADVYLQVVPTHADEREVLVEDFAQSELRSKIVGYGRTLESHPDDTWSYEGLAACHVSLGQPNRALEVLAAHPNFKSPSVYLMTQLGLTHLAGGDATRGVEWLRKAATLDAEYPLAWLGLGKALIATSSFEEAADAFRRAARLAPELSDAHLGLADALLRDGKLDDAGEAAERAVRSAPGLAQPLLTLASIRARQGKM
ncbi:MAG TPA: tetratricopeptide repeat protein, partial [Pirellulaceae bacterium]